MGAKKTVTAAVVLMVAMLVSVTLMFVSASKTSYALVDYKKTESLTITDKIDQVQANYQEKDGLRKSVEWTNKEKGEGKIILSYKLPDPLPVVLETHAVYLMGGCLDHGYTKQIAINDITHLLKYYDTVDVIGTTVGAGLGKEDPVDVTKHAKWGPTRFKKGDTVTLPDTVFKGAAFHHSGAYNLVYLDDYLKTNDPDLIVMAVDGLYAGFLSDFHSTFEENAIVKSLAKYFTFETVSNSKFPSQKVINGYTDEGKSLATKIASYQSDGDGKYIVTCSPEQKSYKTNAGNFDQNDGNYVLALLINPTALSKNEITPGTLNNKSTEDYVPKGQKVYSYGETLEQQEYVPVVEYHELSLSDTVSTDFKIDETNIVSTISGVKGGTVTVNGQTVKVNYGAVKGGDELKLEIPVILKDKEFRTSEDDFKDVNDGPATLVMDKDKYTVDSPKLYKYTAPEVVVPTPDTYSTMSIVGLFIGSVLVIISIIYITKNTKKNSK